VSVQLIIHTNFINVSSMEITINFSEKLKKEEITSRIYIHWTAVSVFKVARLAQESHLGMKCSAYFRLSAGSRRRHEENIILIKHIDEVFHKMYV